MFVIGLHGGLPAQAEYLGRRAVLIGVACPVIVHLMVIGGDDPRHGGVGGLQVGVGLVLGVAATVFIKRIAFWPDMAAQRLEGAAVHFMHAALAVGAFVNVIAIMKDKIDRLIGDIAPGGIIPLLIMLAARVKTDQAFTRLIGFLLRGRGITHFAKHVIPAAGRYAANLFAPARIVGKVDGTARNIGLRVANAAIGAFKIIDEGTLQVIFRIIAARQGPYAPVEAKPLLPTGQPFFTQRLSRPIWGC